MNAIIPQNFHGDKIISMKGVFRIMVYFDNKIVADNIVIIMYNLFKLNKQ